jgi:hypothetical protein
VREFVGSGELMSCGARCAYIYWRIAIYVDKIFNPSNPPTYLSSSWGLSLLNNLRCSA